MVAGEDGDGATTIWVPVFPQGSVSVDAGGSVVIDGERQRLGEPIELGGGARGSQPPAGHAYRIPEACQGIGDFWITPAP